jgi:hypothetical protein
VSAVFKAPNPSACYDVDFTWTPAIECDALKVDFTGDGVPMRATVFKGRSGPVVIASIWMYDVHDNSFRGLPYWKAFHFPPLFVKQIARMLERGYAEAM